ncbi:MAG: hypothetical protein Q8O62_02505 [Aequorivita sp.]|nr:hypothetical protein [Aequorivita sp.]
MDIQAKKLDLIEWLVKLSDESIIEQIYNFKMVTKENSYIEISEEEELGIERGLRDYEAGRISTHEEVTERIKSKYPFLK